MLEFNILDKTYNDAKSLIEKALKLIENKNEIKLIEIANSILDRKI